MAGKQKEEATPGVSNDLCNDEELGVDLETVIQENHVPDTFAALTEHVVEINHIITQNLEPDGRNAENAVLNGTVAVENMNVQEKNTRDTRSKRGKRNKQKKNKKSEPQASRNRQQEFVAWLHRIIAALKKIVVALNQLIDAIDRIKPELTN